jgi:uncharacterized protein (DUF488 family)
LYVEHHPEVLESLSAALREHGVTHRRIALTCFERHPEDCHRGILAAEWTARHRCDVLHLGPDGCKRLVPA